MKFNTKTQGTGTTTNHEGEKAYTLTPALELYTAIASAGLGDKFYESESDALTRLRGLIERNDAAFVARLAIYAREKMYLRSIPLVLTVELAALHSGDDLIARLVRRVVRRADEITELLAYYSVANDRQGTKKLHRLSKQLQKGLASAFNRFDEYQFAKYDRAGAIMFKDALFLVHPKAKDDSQQVLFDKIVKDELEVPYTWEVELSWLGKLKFQSEAERKKAIRDKWTELIASGRLGYMALLRNLRNILVAGVDKATLDKVCGQLKDPGAVAASKQLPFRFLSAYRELTQVKNGFTGKVLAALEQAVLHTTANIAGFDEDTKVVIAADVSGSMQKAVSKGSKVQCFDIGLLLAMLMQNRCGNVITGMFGDTWKAISVPKTRILANVQEFHLREGEVGYSTNGCLVIKDLWENEQVVDKILMFTDCQLWNSNGNAGYFTDLWQKYKQMAPDAKLYLFDLAGYGETPLQINGNDVFLIAGWSDKIFQVLQAIEEGGRALDKINEIAL